MAIQKTGLFGNKTRRNRMRKRKLGVLEHRKVHLVRYLDDAVEAAKTVQRSKRRRQTAVHAQNAVVYDRGQRQCVEHCLERFPHARTSSWQILLEHFIVEAIHYCYLATLVIPT